jgi:hypothetical protein
VNYASDLFQVEVSHLPKTLQFTLIMHIPLVSNANLLELYEFLPLPIHFNFLANVTPDVGQNNLLAIGHSKSFQTISSSAFMHPPGRHLLLQGKESDGDKFENVLFRITLPGKR